MVNESAVIQKRKAKVTAWLKNTSNIWLIVILIFALVLRLYFYYHSSGQPLWWDEADYMSTAKHWALNIPYDINTHRPPLFQYLASLIFSIGLGEQFIRIFLVLIPSAFFVYAVFLLGKTLYNEKVGLIAAFFMSVSWTLLFWTARVQPDFFSISFSVLSLFFMWKYWESDNKTIKFAVYAGIFAALGFHFKVSGMLVPMIFALFAIIKDRLSTFKDKGYYLSALSFIAVMVPYMIWSKINFGTFTAFKTGYSDSLAGGVPFAWKSLSYFKLLTDNIYFILFLLGLILSLKFLMYFDILLKDKKKCLNPDLFSFVSICVIWGFYIFYIRAIEDRWLFLGLPFLSFYAANALLFAQSKLKLDKKIVFAAIIVLIIASGYLQISQANSIIEAKKDSYGPVKEAALWMKENSEKSDKILTISYTQTFYYSERQSISYSLLANESDFDNFVRSVKPKFLEISIFEPHPPWISAWAEKNSAKVIPVHAYFADAQNKQPILIIYSINDNI